MEPLEVTTSIESVVEGLEEPSMRPRSMMPRVEMMTFDTVKLEDDYPHRVERNGPHGAALSLWPEDLEGVRKSRRY